MALILNLDDYKAPQLEVNFGFKKVSVELTDDTTSKMSAFMLDANEMLKKADKLTDNELAKLSREEAKKRLESVLGDARDLLEGAFDEMFNNPGLGVELYNRLGKSTVSLANVFSRVNSEINKANQRKENQKLNRYNRRNDNRKKK
ncbi:hypothetical protein [Limosilactobacillus fermentum]|uniref:hypothetical protein n=1 Tax=Limosilactobacillus fermentum TaxID=1613 RepID=UPI0022E92BD3|nr:hypothetical protein [Limosilactobacillus fermentum]